MHYALNVLLSEPMAETADVPTCAPCWRFFLPFFRFFVYLPKIIYENVAEHEEKEVEKISKRFDALYFYGHIKICQFFAWVDTGSRSK